MKKEAAVHEQVMLQEAELRKMTESFKLQQSEMAR